MISWKARSGLTDMVVYVNIYGKKTRLTKK